MICKRCNHINNDGAKFCIKCGAPMDENYSQSQSINYNQPNYNDYRYPNNNQTDWAQVIKIIIGTLVVVAVIVLLGKQFMGNDNSDVATQSEAASSSNQQSQDSSQSNTDPAYNEYNNYTSKNEYNSYTNNNYTRNNSSSSNKTGGYIISYSSDVLLTLSDIQGLSKQQLRYARNEIYARHGRKFQSQDLRNYFNSKSWYQGVIEPSNFNDKTMLTNIEIKNIQFLKSVENSM